MVSHGQLVLGHSPFESFTLTCCALSIPTLTFCSAALRPQPVTTPRLAHRHLEKQFQDAWLDLRHVLTQDSKKTTPELYSDITLDVILSRVGPPSNSATSSSHHPHVNRSMHSPFALICDLQTQLPASRDPPNYLNPIRSLSLPAP